MKELKKKIAIISVVAMLAACSGAAFAADETKAADANTAAATDVTAADAEKADETAADAEKTDETKTDETAADGEKTDETAADAEKTDETKTDETPADTEKKEEEKTPLTTEQVDQLITALGTFNGIKVVYNDKAIDFDVPPQIINDRTMVPLRAIFEAIGATVSWDGETRTVTAEKDGVKISLTIDVAEIVKNDQKIALDVAPVIVNDRTLVPVRAICESFGSTVDFDAENLTVIIADEAKADDTKADDATAADDTKADDATAADDTKADDATAADDTKADDTAADGAMDAPEK